MQRGFAVDGFAIGTAALFPALFHCGTAQELDNPSQNPACGWRVACLLD